MTATQQAAATTARVDAEIVACIEDCQPDDLLVINETARTWQVTKVVTHDCADDPADDREAKRTLRLVGAQSEGDLVAGLVLERYPDRATCRLHLLATPHWYEVASTIPVSAVRKLATQPPWVVLSRSGSADRYHRPDPVAAARGEAEPACRVKSDAEYRIARITVVYPAKQPCRNCMRQAQPATLAVACPACGRTLADVLAQGHHADHLEGVLIRCPAKQCSFTGLVTATETGPPAVVPFASTETIES